MKKIAIETWKRKKHYNYFKGMSYPHFSLCANVDITLTYNYIKSNNLPMHLTMVYLLTTATNSIEALKYRPREDEIIVHDYLNPAFTVLGDETFSFCRTNYFEDYHLYVDESKKLIEEMQRNPVIEDDPDIDDRLFMTTIPWVSFTNIMHPIELSPADYVPRVAWGKFFDDNGCKKMPLSIQAHHATVDGIDVGKWYEKVEEIFSQPQVYLSIKAKE